MGVACFVACLGGFVVGFFLTGKFDLNHMLIPVVDRPCLALVRQCRKKNGDHHTINAHTGDHFRAAYSLGATDCVSGFPPFGQLFYGGLAGPRYLLEENI